MTQESLQEERMRAVRAVLGTEVVDNMLAKDMSPQDLERLAEMVEVSDVTAGEGLGEGLQLPDDVSAAEYLQQWLETKGSE